MKPVVIFIDDEIKILKGLERILMNREDEWKMKFFSNTLEAIKFLDSVKIDVVVCDINIPDISGIDFIQIVKEKYPGTKRIIVSGTNNRELAKKAAVSAHQFFPKPYSTKILLKAVADLIEASRKLKNDNLENFINSIEKLPVAPQSYAELENELKSEEFSLIKITNIISKNPVVVAKILQLANSAFFGVKGKVTNIVQAVNFLGLNIIKSLVLCIEVFYRIKGVNQKYIDYLWNHSFSVAKVSKEIMKSFSEERNILDITFTSGLLHDIGKIVLLEYKDYIKIINRSEQGNYFPETEMEKKMLGFTHAEIGGYLLRIWGFPEEITEIVENHHSFTNKLPDLFEPVTAVCIANKIVKYKNEPEKIEISDKIKTKYLKDNKIETWINLAVQEGYE